jgi:hypothetical protein
VAAVSATPHDKTPIAKRGKWCVWLAVFGHAPKPKHAHCPPAGKFNNYINFDVHAFVPDKNPTLTALPNSSSGGGKK